MGVVVAATHLQLGQVVALKFIRREALANQDVVSRFEREARAAVRLRSSHVARIIDVGRLDSGSPYIVMEYLEGIDLAGLLEQQGALSGFQACDYIVQACDAIAEAHALGIVHRDLKPGNLFLATGSHGQQILKVLDFGISKSQMAGADPSITSTQAVMGSPGYMSPEQMRSTKNVDGRSDLWSLGVILYELVCGRVPFHADTFTALCLKVAMDPHPPLFHFAGNLPPGLEAIINRTLEKDPDRRFQSAAQLAHALAPYGTSQTFDRANRITSGGNESAASPYVHANPVRSTLHAAAGQACPPTLQTRTGRGRVVALGLALCTFCTLAAGAIAMVSRGGESQGGTHRTAAPPRELAAPAAASDGAPRTGGHSTAAREFLVATPPAPLDAGIDAPPAPPDSARRRRLAPRRPDAGVYDSPD